MPQFMAPASRVLTLFASSLIIYSNVVFGHVVYPEEASLRLNRPTTAFHNSLVDNNNACKLPAPRGIYLSEGFVPKGSRYAPSAPSTGTIKAKLFFVDFSDAPANDTTQSLYDALVPESQLWFQTSSYGRLKVDVDADMTTFYRMPQESTRYTFNRFGAKIEMYIKDALSITEHDYVKNPVHVLYIMPTRNAVEITFSPTKIASTRVPDGRGVIPSIVTYGQDLHLKYGFKILNHETGHVIGLPDLYPADSTKLPRGEWVGGFDIMGLINGTHPDYFAWHKWKLGWLEDGQMDCIIAPGTTRHVLSPVETVDGVKAAVVRLSDTTAFVVELRSQLAPQVVNNTACHLGLVAYVVDTTGMNSRNAPIKVIDAHPGILGCEPTRGGKLTSATVDFAKGEKSLLVEEFGVNVRIETVKDDKYAISLTWDGKTGNSESREPNDIEDEAVEE